MIKTIFSDAHWNELCRAGMEEPIPLHKANLTKSFIYYRPFGIFYVESGYHELGMSTLLAWDHGFLKVYEVAEKLQLKYCGQTADYWLEHTQGSAFKSSIGRKIYAGKHTNLTPQEHSLFKNPIYLFEKDEN